MRPSEVLRQAERYLDRHGVESPRATAEVLMAHLLGTDRAGLYARAEPLSGPEAKAYGRALCRRCAGEPVQHLTGTAAFRRLELRVRPGVFVPRPETEGLVDAALRALEGVVGPTVADVGTGTGAVALSIADERPDARVHATDLNPRAVALTRENAERLGLAVEAHEGDLLEPLPVELRSALDLVVSNPPYVEPEAYEDLPPEVRADPTDALVGGVEVHGRLAAEATAWLRPGGWLVMEIGDAQGDEVREILGQAGYDEVEVRVDLAKRDRVALGRWPG